MFDRELKQENCLAYPQLGIILLMFDRELKPVRQNRTLKLGKISKLYQQNLSSKSVYFAKIRNFFD